MVFHIGSGGDVLLVPLISIQARIELPLYYFHYYHIRGCFYTFLMAQLSGFPFQRFCSENPVLVQVTSHLSSGSCGEGEGEMGVVCR